MAEKSALSAGALSMFLSAKQTYIFQVLPQYFNFVTHAGFKVSMWKQVSKVSPCQSTGKTQGLPGVVPSGWWCRGRSGSELRDGWRSRQSTPAPRSFQQSILMPCWYPYQHHQKMALLNYQKHISCKLIWTDTLLSGLPEHNIHYSTIHTTQYNTTHF